MKRLNTIIIAILLALNIFAQSPEKISYQAVVRNSENNLVTNQQIGMQISILQGEEVSTATTVYSETQTPTTNENGLVTLEIGTGTSSDDFSVIDWGNDIFFIKTETDLEGGVNYSIIGTNQLLSVPFALYATNAGNIPDISNLAEQQALEDSIIAIKNYINELNYQILELQAISGLALQDYDGNFYKIITIGNQTWMAENLRVTHYSDGTIIPIVTDQYDWNSLSDSENAYCYYNNESASQYGALYNHAAAINACPEGWHLPSNEDWTILESYISNDGHNGTEGDALKAFNGWNDNGNGTDNYGFSALPGGYRNGGNGLFQFAGDSGYWWTSTESTTSGVYYRWLSSISSDISWSNLGKSFGFSVRCIKD